MAGGWAGLEANGRKLREENGRVGNVGARGDARTQRAWSDAFGPYLVYNGYLSRDFKQHVGTSLSDWIGDPLP